jgi:hypothetical protein
MLRIGGIKNCYRPFHEVRYMIWSFGVALDGRALILGDNVSVFLNTKFTNSVKNEENVIDVLTKPSSIEKFHYLTMRWLFLVTETIKKKT